MHDLENYFGSSESHTFTHEIHHLRFGPQMAEGTLKRFAGSKGAAYTNHHLNPLDDTDQATDDRAFNYMYFVKVVPTAYLPLGWDNKGTGLWSNLDDVSHELIELGKYVIKAHQPLRSITNALLSRYGHGESGSVETHQYSVTSHKRSLAGGSAQEEGHKERLHARGGIPGVFFSFGRSFSSTI